MLSRSWLWLWEREEAQELPGISSAPAGALLPQELPSHQRAVWKVWSPGHTSFWVWDEHRQSSGTDRPLSGLYRTFSAWVADICTVPSPGSSAPLSTAQQSLLAWARAALKAPRWGTGMQVTTAQAGQGAGQLCWEVIHPWLLFATHYTWGCRDPELALVGHCRNIPFPLPWEVPECQILWSYSNEQWKHGEAFSLLFFNVLGSFMTSTSIVTPL